MKKSFLFATMAACAAGATTLGACATDGDTQKAAPPPSTTWTPTADAGADAPSPEDDAGSCAECEYFPETCTDDVLCPNGLFDATGTGTGLTPMARINVIRGRSRSDVWAAGAMGALAHFDGTSWTISDPGPKETLRALLLRNPGEIVFGEATKIITRGLPVEGAGEPSSGGWTTRPYSMLDWEYYDPFALKLATAWSSPDSERVWLAMTAHTAGATDGLWRLRITPSAPPEIIRALPPYTCSAVPCSQLLAMDGVEASSFWAVGMGGAIVRVTDAESDSPSITAFNSQSWNALQGVWTTSANEAWTVGTQGTIRHWVGDPLVWEVATDVPTNVDLYSVWGSSGNDVWVVGDDAVVLHYDGEHWSRMKIAGLGRRRPTLTAVWVSEPGHVWVGGDGVILSLGGKP